MRKGLIMYVDDVKDKRLIEWLNSKMNKSSFIREKLYEAMKVENGIAVDTTVVHEKPIENKEIEEKKVSKSILTSFLKNCD